MTPQKSFNVFGERVEIWITSKATNNSFYVGTQTSPPGGGPPPHRHAREDEMFMVLEGEYALFEEGQWMPMAKGEVRHALRGRSHTFKNVGTTEGVMFFVVTPGGLDEFLETISPLRVPQDVERLEDICRMYGIEIFPPGDH